MSKNKKTIYTGSACAIVTPLTENGINFKELERLVDFQLENKTDAIVVCGTTGEASTMNDMEHIAVIESVVKRVNGRVPVIAGTGSNDTRHGLSLSQKAEAVGADALLHVTPYYNKTTQAGLIQHFTLMADAVKIPIVLYNVPGRTGLNITPQTLLTLSKHPNIAAIKEASGDIAQVAKMMALCKDDMDFYSGNDDMNTALCALGGKGTISVLANVAPKKTHDMIAAALQGDLETSTALQLEAMELIEALFCEVNPIPVKTALRMMGFDVGPLWMPLCEMSEAHRAQLKAAMEAYGIATK